jgi:integrase
MSAKWQDRFHDQIAPTKIPGVWKRKAGGHRARVTGLCPRTGRKHEVNKVYSDTKTPLEARQKAEEDLREKMSGPAATVPQFGAYAAELFERKVALGDIKSAAGRRKWADVLKHHLVPRFGPIYLDQLQRSDVVDWMTDMGRLVNAGTLKPGTANSRLSVLKVIIESAVVDHGLERNAVLKVEPLATDAHPTYTEEEPNALAPDQVPKFLAAMRDLYPELYALTVLGFATGARPSHLRPLRRAGETPDVLWSEGAVLIRRSHTYGQEVMEKTKTARRQKLYLPDDLVEVLRWHVETQLSPRGLRSELLFPAQRGGLLRQTVLQEPFLLVSQAIKLPFRFTPRGMRRTYQDLSRAAEVPDIVTRAISGHATETMQRHYSTVRADEIRSGIGKVIDLAGVRAQLSGNTSGNKAAS